MSDTKINQKNISVGGDFRQNIDNSINYIIDCELNKAEIYDCLEFFLHMSKKDVEMNITVAPAELNKKLSFNHAGKYIKLFKDYYFIIERVGEVISHDFPDGEIIVSSLKSLFYDTIPTDAYDDNGEYNIVDGSHILDVLRKKIADRIKNDTRYDPDKLSVEVVDSFVIAFVGYGVSECQILQNPNQC